jgi:hypothetical protein
MKKITKIILTFGIITNLNSQCFLNKTISVGAPLETTGSEKLDYILSSESTKIKNLFKVDVELFAYDDQNKPNAFASPVCRTLGCHGSVAIGKTLLLDELVMSSGYSSICGIMAHEFAHILQYQQKSKLKGKFSELQADYLAGWYLGRTKNLEKADLKSFAVSLFNKGDYDFYSQLHHGTPEERSKIMILGFSDYDLDLKDVYSKSFDILSDLDKHISSSNIEKQLQKQQPNRAYPTISATEGVVRSKLSSRFLRKINGKYGYVDENNNLVISPIFDEAYEFDKNGDGVVRIAGVSYVIDKNGNCLTPTCW